MTAWRRPVCSHDNKQKTGLLDAQAATMNDRRRVLGTLALSALTIPLAGLAQETKELPRVGYLVSQDPDYYFELFQGHMRQLGYVDGSNIVFERRYAKGELDRIPGLVEELMQKKVRVLVAPNNVAIEATRKAKATMPVVMAASIDPVAAGYVATLARPGGNITGIVTLNRALGAKRIEMLQEILPKLTRLAILWDADGPGPKVAIQNYERAAHALKVRVQSLAIHGPKPDLEGALHAAKAARAELLLVVANPLVSQHRAALMALALKHRIPVMAEHGIYLGAGALVSYGADYSKTAERLAVYVDKILKGAKPADLPVEQPTTFELGLNLKTARALDIKIPRTVLLRADKVIE